MKNIHKLTNRVEKDLERLTMDPLKKLDFINSLTTSLFNKSEDELLRKGIIKERKPKEKI